MGAPEPRATSPRAVALAAGLVALGLLGGCAALAPHFEHPRLFLLAIEVRDATLAEQHLRVRMRVENPNDQALPVRGIDYTLQVGGEDFGAGSSVSAFTVPPHGEAEFEMMMTTNLAATLWKVLPRLKDSSQPIDYRLVGKVSTDLAFLRTVPFDQRGVFPVR